MSLVDGGRNPSDVAGLPSAAGYGLLNAFFYEHLDINAIPFVLLLQPSPKNSIRCWRGAQNNRRPEGTQYVKMLMVHDITIQRPDAVMLCSLLLLTVVGEKLNEANEDVYHVKFEADGLPDRVPPDSACLSQASVV